MEAQLFTVNTKYRDLSFTGYDFGAQRLLATADVIRLPEGHVTRSEGKLKEGVEIPPGTALHKRRVSGNVSHDFYVRGFEDLRSALMRIKQFEEVTDPETVMYARQAIAVGATRVRNYRVLSKADQGRIVQLEGRVQYGIYHARNQWKASAAIYLKHASSLRDSRNRVNPGKTLAELTAAKRMLALREEEILAILGYIPKDALIAESVLWEVRAEFESVNEALGTWILRMRDPGSPMKSVERAHLALAFRACAKRLRDEVVILPYRPSAEMLADELVRFESKVMDLPPSELIGILNAARRVVRAQSYRSDVLNGNVELGLLEESPRASHDLQARYVAVTREVRSAMGKALAGVPTHARAGAKSHLTAFLKLCGEHKELNGGRQWLKNVRDEVRAFAEHIV